MTSLRNYNKHDKNGKYSQGTILIKSKTGGKNNYKYLKTAEFIIYYVSSPKKNKI